MRRILALSLFLFLCWAAYVAGAGASYHRLGISSVVTNGIDASVAVYKKIKRSTRRFLHSQMAAPTAPKENRSGDITGEAQNSKDAYQGYTLISPYHNQHVYLIDMDGNIVHKWVLPVTKKEMGTKGLSVIATDVMPDGSLLAQFTGLGMTPYGQDIIMLDVNSKLLWRYNDHSHHDFYVDEENGNIYSLVHEILTKKISGLESLPYPILADFIVTLSPDGTETDRISLLEAFRDSPYALILNSRSQGSRKGWDHTHTNSIMKLEPEMAAAFPMFKPGSLLVSIRNLNTIAVVDPDTRKVVWAYSGLWIHQHSARFTTSGHIILLDNLGYFANGRRSSRIIELDPKTLHVPWVYAGARNGRFSIPYTGRTERLPNGNTLILSSLQGRIFEVTPDKKMAWQYRILTSPGVYGKRITDATRYHPDALPFLKELKP